MPFVVQCVCVWLFFCLPDMQRGQKYAVTDVKLMASGSGGPSSAPHKGKLFLILRLPACIAKVLSLHGLLFFSR